MPEPKTKSKPRSETVIVKATVIDIYDPKTGNTIKRGETGPLPADAAEILKAKKMLEIVSSGATVTASSEPTQGE